MGTPLKANLLDNAVLPPGTNASIKSFTVAGSPTVYTPGPANITLVNPTTGATAGTLQVLPNGDVTFTPAPGYVGPVPTVVYVVASTDGQTDPSALNIDVVAGEGCCVCVTPC
jgi:hypothetical protein